MPRLVLGNVPKGEDYFGQEALLEELRDKLTDGHVLLAGPRRYGKTGAMYALMENPPEGLIPIFMNVEHLVDSKEFMLELVSELAAHKRFRQVFHSSANLAGKLLSYLRDLPEELEALGIKIKLRERTERERDWLSLGDEALGLMVAQGAPALIMIDEFPVMVDRIAARSHDEASRLLHWFRRARQIPGTKTRFLIGGSIHLYPTLDAWGLVGTVNDLSAVQVRVFDLATTAPAFVRGVRDEYSMPLADELIPVVLEQVGAPIPYILAVYLDALKRFSKRTGGALDRDTLKQVFEEEIIGGKTAQDFRHYRRRIDNYYPDQEKPAALILLERMASDETGAQTQALYHLFLSTFRLPGDSDDQQRFLNLLGKLENDFYIERTAERCRFFSRALRLWWLRNQCLTPRR